MHVLILGGRGMLGRELVAAFHDVQVTAWDKKDADIADPVAAERIPAVEPDLVVNAAAYTDVDGAETASEEADAVNGYAVGNLAVACAETNIPLLHISTEYVFGEERENGYAEDAEPQRPLNAYGRSKLLGETLLKESGKDFWLVRTAWLYGLHGHHFLEKILSAATGKAELPVVADVFGSPTYAADLALAIRRLVRDRAAYGTYHLVNSGVASRAELAEEFFRLLQLETQVRRVPAREFPTRAPRPRWSILQNTKRPALRPWPEALKAYVHARASA